MYPTALGGVLPVATSFVPSDDDATEVHSCWGAAVCVQVAPESDDV